MRLKQLFAIMLLSVLMLACDNANEPSRSSKYEFSSVKFEKCVVYGEGGKVIPKSEWNGDINELYDDYKVKLDGVKLYMFKKSAERILLYSDFGIIDMEYLMKRDTILLNVDEEDEIYMPWGVVINDKTIELHFSVIGYGIGDVNDSGFYGEGGWIIDKPDFDEIDKDEVVCYFKSVLIFKR